MTVSTRQVYFNYCESRQDIPVGIEGASCFGYLRWFYFWRLLGGWWSPVAGGDAGQGQSPARSQDDFSTCLTKGITLFFILLRRLDSYYAYVYGYILTEHSTPFSHTYSYFLCFLSILANSHFFMDGAKSVLICNHSNYRNKLSLNFIIRNLDLINILKALKTNRVEDCDVNKFSVHIF